jgi:hypothetical protein
MTVQEYVAGQTIRAAEALAHFVQTTEADRLVWQPEGEAGVTTRSAFQQISECVQVNGLMAKMLRKEAVAAPAGPRPDIAFKDGADAQEQLMASARGLADAIRNLADADLDAEYQHPRGLMLGSNLILMAYRNMIYHAGQINFIQTLYGDTEFHVPPNWR